jgi:hypothetical protein
MVLEKKEFEEREKFLNVYQDFDAWLSSFGFERKFTNTGLDIHYYFYDDYINSLYGVEHYVIESLNFSMRFLRDRFEHKFMFVGKLGSFSETYNIDEMKQFIYQEVEKLLHEKLTELKPLIELFKK